MFFRTVFEKTAIFQDQIFASCKHRFSDILKTDVFSHGFRKNGTLAISTSYFEVFRFTCVNENQSKLVKDVKYYVYDCLRKLFFAISALSTLFPNAFLPLKILNLNSRPKFSLLVNIVILIF